MDSTARVYSIEGLEAWKSSLISYASKTREYLNRMDLEARRAIEYLHDRRSHWRRVVENYREEVVVARRALNQCLQDEENDCSNEEDDLATAKRHLREAEAELENVQRWIRQVESVAADYMVQSQRMKQFVSNNLSKADSFLGRIVSDLHGYVNITPPDTSSNSHNTGLSTDSAAPEASNNALQTNAAQHNGEDAHYLYRPNLRQSLITAVKKSAQKIDGRWVDANTHMPFEGDYQIGHRYGHEFWKYQSWAESQGMTQEDFNDLMNSNPDIYQIENPISNMSHQFEAPDDIFYGDDMRDANV